LRKGLVKKSFNPFRVAVSAEVFYRINSTFQGEEYLLNARIGCPAWNHMPVGSWFRACVGFELEERCLSEQGLQRLTTEWPHTANEFLSGQSNKSRAPVSIGFWALPRWLSRVCFVFGLSQKWRPVWQDKTNVLQ